MKRENKLIRAQKGFTFVELLVIMVIVAILSGIGIQFVLGTQENKAKLVNAKNFMGKDVPTAIFSYAANLGRSGLPSANDGSSTITDILVADGLEDTTEWGDIWSAVTAWAASDTQRIVLCYPLDGLGGVENRTKAGDDLFTYLSENTSWGVGDGTFTLVTTAGISGSNDADNPIGNERSGTTYCTANDFLVQYVLRDGR